MDDEGLDVQVLDLSFWEWLWQEGASERICTVAFECIRQDRLGVGFGSHR